MLVVIDNYDSFTWNLVQYLGELGAEPRVLRNDETTVEGLEALAPDRLVISPGPCTPSDAGVSVEAIRTLGPRIPVLGVCLGHQAAAEAFGGRTVRASQVMHGKTGRIGHTGQGLFQDLPIPLDVARYHSLVTDPQALPPELEVTAWTVDESAGPDDAQRLPEPVEEVQGIRHRKHPVWGIQFHPESLFSQAGPALLANFLAI